MARPLDRREQSDLSPNQAFSPESQSQFTTSQYPYPHGPGDYPIDHDLTMSDNYSQNIHTSIGSSLDDAASAVARNGQVNPIEINTNGAAGPGMAPPQTPQQPGFSPGGQRMSIDEAPDPTGLGDSSKRKRSKVSRACDECRRKKVKCDAAAEDGTIKTCTNCTKAGLTCEYSRVPMKRGPSKGYIKELSERVQQVESLQMQMSGQSGFRASLDAASNPGGYAEAIYSPDDPSSQKRNLSFSDTRNPFAQAEFERDRIPSLGGWGVSSPFYQAFRSRDRGSLAIAPDQQLPPVSYSEYSKPFWETFEEPPPAKRRKYDHDNVAPFPMTANHLDKYYDNIHPQFPILPERDTALTIVQNTSSVVGHCFAVVVDLLLTFKHSKPSSDQNGNHDGVSSHNPGDISKFFINFTDIADFLLSSSQEQPESRSVDENLIYLWISLLLAIQAESDMGSFKSTTLSRTHALKFAIDIAMYLKSHPSLHENSSIKDPSILQQILQQDWNLSCMLAKLHALSLGTGDYVSLQQYSVHTDTASNLPSTVAFNVRASNLLALVLPLIQDGSLPQSQFNVESKNLTLRFHLLNCVLHTEKLSKDDAAVLKWKLFLELLLARYTPLPHPVVILQPAIDLAEALSSASTRDETDDVFDPLELHLFTLTTITLLEFLSDIADSDMCKLAEAALTKLQPIIERRFDQQKNNHQSSTFYQQDNSENHISKRFHWSECLIGMIEERRKIGWATERGVKPSDNGLVMIDFMRLLKYGYLNVLVKWCDRPHMPVSNPQEL